MAYINTSYLWMFGPPRYRMGESADQMLSGSAGSPTLMPSYVENYTAIKDGAKPLGAMVGGNTGDIHRLREINVINEFEWTTSPVPARHDTPAIRLKEMYVKANPMINQIAHNLGIVGEGVVDMATGKGVDELSKKLAEHSGSVRKVTGAMKTRLDKIGDGLANFKGLNLAGGEGKNNAVGDSLDTLQSAGKNALKSAGVVIDQSGQMTANLMDLAGGFEKGDPLNPYRLMYVTQLTGFSYVMPYFDNYHKSTSSQWGDTQPAGSETFGESILEFGRKGSEMMGNIAQIRNVLEPGKYIEQPQFFNSYSSNKRSYKVSFPLSNTGSYSEVLKNWQLVYLLVYQNTQNRISRTLVAPPVIYEAEIPGVWYSPYAYISDLSVEYLGARRRMVVEVPKAPASAISSESDTNTPISLDTIIPDAYQVSLTITDMHSESQNFLHRIIQQKDKVTTYETWQSNDADREFNDVDDGKFRIPILNKLKNLF